MYKCGFLLKMISEANCMNSMKLRQKIADKIFKILDTIYSGEKTALFYETPFQLLIATILSAQCTDSQVNKVTETLFKKYTKPEDFLSVSQEELEKDIRPTGFYKNKAKSLMGCSEVLIKLYGGKVPQTLEELIKLPGVGRKTANCVLGAVYDIPGVVVDTHVKRLAKRMGLTEEINPDKIELDLQKILPEEKWRRFSDLLIYHGRSICKARNPNHESCPVNNICPSARES